MQTRLLGLESQYLCTFCQKETYFLHNESVRLFKKEPEALSSFFSSNNLLWTSIGLIIEALSLFVSLYPHINAFKKPMQIFFRISNTHFWFFRAITQERSLRKRTKRAFRIGFCICQSQKRYWERLSVSVDTISTKFHEYHVQALAIATVNAPKGFDNATSVLLRGATDTFLVEVESCRAFPGKERPGNEQNVGVVSVPVPFEPRDTLIYTKRIF